MLFDAEVSFAKHIKMTCKVCIVKVLDQKRVRCYPSQTSQSLQCIWLQLSWLETALTIITVFVRALLDLNSINCSVFITL